MAKDGHGAAVPGVSHRYSHDNLHICLSECFEPPQADAVMELLRRNRQTCKRIFIDVRAVHSPQSSALTAFKSSLRLGGFGTPQLIFKGQGGFAMAINGNRVLLPQEKPHKCKGNCAHCTCRHGKRT